MRLKMKKTVLILASGPSMSKIPHPLLKSLSHKFTTIAVNDTALWFPDSDYAFTLDTIHLKNKYVLPKFNGIKVAAVPEDYGTLTARYSSDRVNPAYGILYVPRIAWQPEDNLNAIRSGCSGYGAYELAYKNGAENIFLFGCDHSDIGKYFYGTEVKTGNQPKNWEAALSCWDNSSNREAVYNVSPDSKIEAFDKISWRHFCLKMGRLPSPIVCVMKSGGSYNFEHVNSLYRQLYRFDLHNHAPDGMLCQTLPLKTNWPGWWSKMEMFAPYNFLGDFLYIDLDSTFIRDPSMYLCLDETVVLRDFYKPLRNIGSGLMFVKREDCYEVWEAFRRDPETHMKQHKGGGDQMFIDKFFAKKTSWQDKFPNEIVSYKVHCQTNGVPPSAKIVCFHGIPKPWDIPSWSKRYE